MKTDDFLSSLPDIPIVQKETEVPFRYYWDNSIRQNGGAVILQRTLRGSVAFWTGGRRLEAGEGEALLFRWGEDTRYGLDADCRRPYGNLWIQMTEVPVVVSMYADLIGAFGPVLRMAPKGEAANLLGHLYESRNAGGPRDRFSDAEAVMRLLIAVYREQVADRRGHDPVSYGRHLLETRFRSPRNLKEWAVEIGISREHFTREFRARYGETPAVFLRRLRLRHARLLLSTPGLRLEDVAAASGFASFQTFHRAYRDVYGLPPGEDRTRWREEM